MTGSSPAADDTYVVFAAALEKTGAFELKIVETLSADDAKEKLAKRQANAAVALVRMNQAHKVWPLLKHSPDPRVRSSLVHWLAPRGADAAPVIERLDAKTEGCWGQAPAKSSAQRAVASWPNC